jgi:hypothetical protein
MNSEERDRSSARGWICRVLPLSIVVVIVGSLGMVLYRAVGKARNAAMSTATQ